MTNFCKDCKFKSGQWCKEPSKKVKSGDRVNGYKYINVTCRSVRNNISSYRDIDWQEKRDTCPVFKPNLIMQLKETVKSWQVGEHLKVQLLKMYTKLSGTKIKLQ